MGDDMKMQLALLEQLDTELDVLNDKVDEFTAKEETQSCQAKTKAKINWVSSYGIYTLYYLWLKMNEIDPRNHPITKEMKRLEEFREKLTNAIKAQEENTITTINNNIIVNPNANRIGSNVNKEASKRIVTNILGKK